MPATPAPIYWHGGFPGLSSGDPLLSPRDAASTGQRITYTPRDRPEFGIVSRTDRVYFSTILDFARAYAFQTEVTTRSGIVVSRGTLYTVTPTGAVDEDPDFAGRNISWCSTGAIVTDVIETNVLMRTRDATRAIGSYATWDDGRPMYLEDGRLCVTWQMESHGITQATIDEIVRPWTPVETALERIHAAATRNHTTH